AAQNNDTRAVRLMLDLGWPVDERGQSGGTALHWAAFHGNAEMTRQLLRHRATVDLKSLEYDGTALQWSQHGSAHGWHRDSGDYRAVAELLVNAGARET